MALAATRLEWRHQHQGSSGTSPSPVFQGSSLPTLLMVSTLLRAMSGLDQHLSSWSLNKLWKLLKKWRAVSHALIIVDEQNPQMDLQAIDRCHRIGQTKPVHMYRLATAQSVEGRVLKRAFNKLRLENVVIGKGQLHLERLKTDNEVLEVYTIYFYPHELHQERPKIENESLSDFMGSQGSMPSTLPRKGLGWEVIIPTAIGWMLSIVNN